MLPLFLPARKPREEVSRPQRRKKNKTESQVDSSIHQERGNDTQSTTPTIQRPAPLGTGLVLLAGGP